MALAAVAGLWMVSPIPVVQVDVSLDVEAGTGGKILARRISAY